MDIRKGTAVLVTGAALLWAWGCSPESAYRAGTETETAKERAAARETDEESSPANETDAAGEAPLSCISINKILELADKEDLSRKDLEGYQYQDIGSGLMILDYDVNKDFSLMAGQTGFDEEPMYIRLVSAEDKDYIDIREKSRKEVEDFLENHSSRTEAVGIEGHVKEIHNDRILLQSHADDFPGVFWVLGISEALAGGELKEGQPILVLMEDMESRAEDGIEKYLARWISALSEEGMAQEDILLNSPPVLNLSDPRSSTMSSFEVYPGNFNWNTANGEGIVACGPGPWDETVLKSAAKLKLPSYNGMDKILYSYFMSRWPDKLTIRQWDKAEAGNEDAQEDWVADLYCRMPFLELEKGKAYEFLAEWEKGSTEKNRCWGNARYLFVTE